MPCPRFPNVYKHTASSTGLAWAVPLRKAGLGKGGIITAGKGAGPWDEADGFRPDGWPHIGVTKIGTHCRHSSRVLPWPGGRWPVLLPYLPPNVLSNQGMLMIPTPLLHASSWSHGIRFEVPLKKLSDCCPCSPAGKIKYVVILISSPLTRRLRSQQLVSAICLLRETVAFINDSRLTIID